MKTESFVSLTGVLSKNSICACYFSKDQGTNKGATKKDGSVSHWQEIIAGFGGLLFGFWYHSIKVLGIEYVRADKPEYYVGFVATLVFPLIVYTIRNLRK